MKHEVRSLITVLLTVLFSTSVLNTSAQENDIPAGETTFELPPRKEGKGWFMEFAPGYGIPFMRTNLRSPLIEIGDKDWYQRGQRDLNVEPIFGTVGGGFSGALTFGHMFNKHIGIDASVTFTRHPRRLDSRIDKDGYFASQYTGTDAFYLAPHLVFNWTNEKRFGLTGRVGILLPFYGSPISDVVIRDREGRMLQTLTGGPVIGLPAGLTEITLRAKTITRLNPTLGVDATISAEYKVMDNFWIYGQVRFAGYTVSLRETEFLEATMETKILGITVDQVGPLRATFSDVKDAPEFLRVIKYRKEITKDSNTGRYGGRVDFDQPMDELGIRYNPTTMYFSIGFRYQMDRWTKGRGERKTMKRQG